VPVHVIPIVVARVLSALVVAVLRPVIERERVKAIAALPIRVSLVRISRAVRVGNVRSIAIRVRIVRRRSPRNGAWAISRIPAISVAIPIAIVTPLPRRITIDDACVSVAPGHSLSLATTRRSRLLSRRPAVIPHPAETGRRQVSRRNTRLATSAAALSCHRGGH